MENNIHTLKTNNAENAFLNEDEKEVTKTDKLVSKFPKNEVVQEALAKFHLLTEKEKMYARVILGQGGVLYLLGEPGIAKSAILRTIANKFDWNFIDLRLSLIDETDVGVFPYLNEHSYTDEEGNNKIQKYLAYATPQWAIEANEKPTLIGFEEVNRCSLAVRNASLGIFNEREVAGYKLNRNVFMAATGNLGEADGTEVEELDKAVMNRLIPMNHTLTPEDWKVGYANDNVHPLVISFLQAYDWTYFNEMKVSNYESENGASNTKKGKDSGHSLSKQYPSVSNPRSLDNYSKFLIVNYGYTIDDVVNAYKSSENAKASIIKTSMSYLGASAGNSFNDFINNLSKVSLQDILNDYDNHATIIEKYGREYRSDILNRVCESVKISELKKNQIKNLNKFLAICDADERTGYLRNIYRTYVMGPKRIRGIEDVDANVVELFKPYKEESKMLFKIIESNSYHNNSN